MNNEGKVRLEELKLRGQAALAEVDAMEARLTQRSEQDHARGMAGASAGHEAEMAERQAAMTPPDGAGV